MNQLYYGDNLQVLKEHIADESVDLIYLDPPFNSKRDYNLLFKSPKGVASEAQIEAFEDTWHWNEQAEREFDELLHQPNTQVADMMRALRGFLGENDMMAYLTMMANRLLELHRVLKPTGSLYLHCDPTASHYLKIVLDGVFGPEKFRSEIVWRRSNVHNKTTKQYGPIHDTIFFYTKTDIFPFHPGSRPHMRGYIREWFTGNDEQGSFRTNMLTGPGIRFGDSGKPWRGFDPTSVKRHWAVPRSLRTELPPESEKWTTQQVLEFLDEKGHIYIPRDGLGQPKYVQRISAGSLFQDIWSYQPYTQGTLYGTEECIDEDVRWLEHEEEKLGYPTQKPVGLLGRIISTSTGEGDVVLDPFCGCGTAVDAAQKLKRKWIGIDITHLAISLIEKRLKDRYKGRAKFEVHGTPKDLDGARNLAERDKYQFQWWAVSLVDAQPFQRKKKGADTGIDGVKFFRDLDRKEVRKIVVSVKGGGIKPDDVRALNHVREREKAEVALFISLEQPTPAMVKDAASVGFYNGVAGKKFPRVQLLTIAGLLDGRERAEHPDYEPDLNFKRAKAESDVEQQPLI